MADTVAVSLLARHRQSLLSNLNEPRNDIVRGVSVSPAFAEASSWPSATGTPWFVIAFTIRAAIFKLE